MLSESSLVTYGHVTALNPQRRAETPRTQEAPRPHRTRRAPPPIPKLYLILGQFYTRISSHFPRSNPPSRPDSTPGATTKVPCTLPMEYDFLRS
ncbi:hypothetical protein FRB93_006593 [Tulasnella sp. JGI-2019a]|nr:hypothetical protein FRB93_006593 [Tulasnella sp. JGI-2019a]